MPLIGDTCCTSAGTRLEMRACPDRRQGRFLCGIGARVPTVLWAKVEYDSEITGNLTSSYASDRSSDGWRLWFGAERVTALVVLLGLIPTSPDHFYTGGCS